MELDVILIINIYNKFICLGCILVYRVYEPEYNDPRSPNYCNKTVYLYAFWLITSTFIVLGIFISCLLCLAVSSVFANSDQQNDEDA